MFKKQNRMFNLYMARLAARVVIFLAVFAAYIFRREILSDIVERPFLSHFSPMHVLWVILMCGMLLHLIPKIKITMSEMKSRSHTYTEPKGGYSRPELLEYVQAMNIRAWRVALIWLSFNAIFGILYLLDVIGNAELVLLTCFYFLADLICMMLFCPFQKYMMGNRCCVNCRIFDWGHMMMYTPMLFIRSFFSWSLLFTALIVMVRWELVYAKHPERFWRGSNATIRCENCCDKTCRIKKPLVTGIDKIASKMPTPADLIAKSADDMDVH